MLTDIQVALREAILTISANGTIRELTDRERETLDLLEQAIVKAKLIRKLVN